MHTTFKILDQAHDLSKPLPGFEHEFLIQTDADEIASMQLFIRVLKTGIRYTTGEAGYVAEADEYIALLTERINRIK